jgi:hypothetical protein
MTMKRRQSSGPAALDGALAPKTSTVALVGRGVGLRVGGADGLVVGRYTYAPEYEYGIEYPRPRPSIVCNTKPPSLASPSVVRNAARSGAVATA